MHVEIFSEVKIEFIFSVMDIGSVLEMQWYDYVLLVILLVFVYRYFFKRDSVQQPHLPAQVCVHVLVHLRLVLKTRMF